MTIQELSIQVCKREGLKKQVNIAQIKEILKVINRLTSGKFYKLIRAI